MKFLSTDSIYTLQEVIDHLDTGGALDFNQEYAVKLDSFEGEYEKSYKVVMSGHTVFVPKSKSDYQDGDDRIDINGWMLDTIIKQNLE